MMHRWFVRSIAFGVVVLLLSACVTSQTSTMVQSDGSGTNEFVIAMLSEEMMKRGVGDPFEDVQTFGENLPAEWSPSVEPWEDDTHTGIKIVTQFSDPAMLETQLNKVLGPGTMPEAKQGGSFSAFEVQHTGNSISIHTQFQSATPDGSAPVENFKLLWSVSMPGIETYTEDVPATRTGNHVTWHLPSGTGETYDLHVQGSLDPNAVSPPPTTTEEPAQPAPVPTGERCFPDVPGIDACLSGRIRQYWEENGGLPVFGYPITPQREETIEGQSLQVQWFQRNRLELHPENERPYDVLLGRLGVDVLEKQGRDWQAFPASEDQGNCVFFEQTSHYVCGDILNAWRANGLELDGQPGFSQAENLALFGLPVSGPIQETLSDGNDYTVQYFERARFELHPEHAPPNNVLLGLLGEEVGGSGE